MSGIFGIFNRNGETINKTIVNMMLDTMSLWTPDETDSFIEGPIALGNAMVWNTPESKYEHLPLEKDESILIIDARLDNRYELAKELDLPLNVHSRSAGRHAVTLLLECNAVKVQMHAFDGKTSAALPALEAGYFFSIPPSVVRSRQKQKLVKNLPLSNLLVESDSPVLGPDPNQRNEPVNVAISIKAIAELKNISEAEAMEAVTQNTRSLYGDI